MSKSVAEEPPWIPFTLKVAAVYNLVWGTFVIFCPTIAFGWLGIETPNYPSIIQCLGMVIGVYGIGYWIAASDAATHWPIVLVGLLGKVFGPIGFVYTAFRGELPWNMGLTILTNDLVWWWPFTAILVFAARVHESNRTTNSGLTLESVLKSSLTQNGQNLYEQSFLAPLLLVCVRHFGCTFCRETLSDLALQREDIDKAGLIPVIVHMGSNEQAIEILKQFGVSDVAHVSDPERHLFQTLEIPFGTLNQLISLKTLWRAIGEGLVFRFGFGTFVGNGLQLSGAFIVKEGRVQRAIRHESAAERTDFTKLSCDSR